jgi:hypothetical protein
MQSRQRRLNPFADRPAELPISGVDDDVRHVVGDLRLPECPAPFVEIRASLGLLCAIEHQDPKALL